MFLTSFFVWVHDKAPQMLNKGKTAEGLNYSINQEKYLKYFLNDGEVPIGNNATEQSIRGFCIGKKNWVLIDTINGAKSSAIVYSITETAKANKLKPYECFEYLLTEIPKHLNGTERSFLEDLLPWSPNLPENIKKHVATLWSGFYCMTGMPRIMGESPKERSCRRIR